MQFVPEDKRTIPDDQNTLAMGTTLVENGFFRKMSAKARVFHGWTVGFDIAYCGFSTLSESNSSWKLYRVPAPCNGRLVTFNAKISIQAIWHTIPRVHIGLFLGMDEDFLSCLGGYS